MTAITVYRFGATPSYEFDDLVGTLHGFDQEHRDVWEGDQARWSALYAALDTSEDDEETVPGVLPDGRYALIGLTVSDHPFAVEDVPA